MERILETFGRLANSGLLAAASATIGIVCFRLMPFVAFVLLRRTSNYLPKTGLLLASGAVASLLPSATLRDLLYCVCGYVYFIGTASLIYWIANGQGELRRGGGAVLFMALFALLLLVPATVLRTLSLGTFLTLGWELTLKAYSFANERRGKEVHYGAYLFFMLVDPTIVFAERATTEGEHATVHPASRVLAGIVALASTYALSPLALLLLDRGIERGGAWRHACTLLCAFVVFMTAYGKQAGVASLQIGAMRSLGFSVKERFDHPLAATSPADFWRRWNTYVGSWARRYVYAPLALGLARRRWPPLASRGTAALLTFAAIGAFHDAYSWLRFAQPTFQMTAFFVANGFLLLAWEAQRALNGKTRSAEKTWGHFGNISRAAFCVAFLMTVSASFV